MEPKIGPTKATRQSPLRLPDSTLSLCVFASRAASTDRQSDCVCLSARGEGHRANAQKKCFQKSITDQISASSLSWPLDDVQQLFICPLVQESTLYELWAIFEIFSKRPRHFVSHSSILACGRQGPLDPWWWNRPQFDDARLRVKAGQSRELTKKSQKFLLS